MATRKTIRRKFQRIYPGRPVGWVHGRLCFLGADKNPIAEVPNAPWMGGPGMAQIKKAKPKNRIRAREHLRRCVEEKHSNASAARGVLAAGY